MLTPPVVAVAVAALVVFTLAAWFSVPQAPDLDGERWFKALLARVLLRTHSVEAVGRWVPYHPLGRAVERKLRHPAVAALPGAALPGEVALVGALAALPDATSRFAALFPALHTDLIDAGPWSRAHDPARWLGPALGWDAGLDRIAEAVESRATARWALVPGEVDPVPAVGAAIAAFATPVPCPPLDVDPAAAEGVGTRLAEDLLAVLPGEDAAARLLVAATGTGVIALLRALAASPALRDRVIGVLSVGGALRGLSGGVGLTRAEVSSDWLDAWFRHELLDVEVVREVPYLCLQWIDPAVDPPGAGGLPVQDARFPEPQFVGTEPPMVRVVDLGVLPVGPDLPAAEVASALRAVAALWAWSRR